MLKTCVKNVEWLCKASGQVVCFCTFSTSRIFKSLPAKILYPITTTGFAQLNCAFTQFFLRNFTLLSALLCPLPTPTMITTNLIKE
jgi:hypothetical protein